MVAGTVTAPVLVGVGTVTALVVLAAALVAGAAWWTAVVAVMVGAAVAYGIVRRTVARLGGITGDVLGAVVELTMLTLLLGVALG
jgi:adenosylcobinamide-GDP ribazoletransferase